MDTITAQLQRLMDNLRERPWIVFLALSIAFGATGWMKYTDEVDRHELTLQAAIAAAKEGRSEYKKATDETIGAQQKTIILQDKLLMKKDTAK